jgi:hypothetical protein
VTTTHALLAGKVQRKVRDGVAQFRHGSSPDRPKIAAIPTVSASITAKILGIRAELRIANLLAQTRIVSVARIRAGPRQAPDSCDGYSVD